LVVDISGSPIIDDRDRDGIAARSQPGVPDPRDRRRVITRLLRSVPEECLRQKRSGVRHDRIPEELLVGNHKVSTVGLLPLIRDIEPARLEAGQIR
jgi:hypothetical protein